MPNRIKVIGRVGSNYRKQVVEWLGNSPINTAHFAVNYGLQGARLADYRRRWPGIARLPILNETQRGSKYNQVKIVGRAGETVPESMEALELDGPNHEDWIIKPKYSLGGRDIHLYAGGNIPDTHYIQERIKKRRYEIRVHAFAWVDPKDWVFQKRVHDQGEDVLAWNHHNGGRFITIENPTDPLHDRIRESVKVIMKALGYQFGGVDFIIQNPGQAGAKLKHYFIEWNLAPGWTLENTKKYYEGSFKALLAIDRALISAMIDGIYPWEMVLDEGDNVLVNPFVQNLAQLVDDGPRQWDVERDEIRENAQARIDRQNEERRVIRAEHERVMAEALELQRNGAQENPLNMVPREPHPPIVDGVMDEGGPVPMPVRYCPTCGQSQAPMADYAEVNYCFICGLDFRANLR